MSTPASPSFKIVGGDGKEYGPIDLTTLQQWAREGRVAGSTQVWDSRTGNWQPAAQIAELAAAFSAPPPAPAAAAPSAESATAPAPGVELAEQILQRGYTVAFGDWLRQGWDFFKANMGFALGVCWIVFGLSFGASAIGMIPCFGAVVQLAFNLVVQPVLIGGVWYVLLQRRRGQPATIGGVFDGFKLFFAQSILVNLIMGLIILATVIPGAIVAGIGGVAMKSQEVIGVLLIAVGVLLALVPVFYLSICYAFAMPLVADRRMQFWPALETSRRVVARHWFAIFAYSFVVGLLSLAGLLACIVGIIFTLPMCFCMFVVAYDNIFGRPA
ncbi:MAG: GYF domain-containing protein [Verrucomicrobia bacterium]|nr:GYF domain-containing protein [Verrucomicrobiota bacterium]